MFRLGLLSSSSAIPATIYDILRLKLEVVRRSNDG